MVVPVDRASFKEYCLRRLGKPVIEVNIDDDQVDDRVDEALRYYWDYHFDGADKAYFKYQVNIRKLSDKLCNALVGILRKHYPPSNKGRSQFNAAQIICAQHQMKKEQAAKLKREKRKQKLKLEAIWGFGIVLVIFTVWWLFALVVDDRIKKYPQLGTDWIPKTQAQRDYEALPKKYVGR